MHRISFLIVTHFVKDFLPNATMKKYIVLSLITVLLSFGLSAQQVATIYNPAADANKEVAAAVVKAAADGKYVFLQIGYNTCPWCVKFHKMVTEDAHLDSLLNANFEVVMVNYSKENYNKELLASLGYPQRFGFPVFVILDNKGKVLNTQDSWYLEQDKGYNHEKVEHLFRMWSPLTLKEASIKYNR
jgi:thioredoxin-related protein